MDFIENAGRMKKKNDGKSVEESMRLKVHSKLMFQVGPDGQDPIVETIETSMKADMVRITQKDAQTLTVRASSGKALNAVKAKISKWVDSMETTTLVLDSATAVVRAAAKLECDLYLKNQPWIASLKFENDAVEIRGIDAAITVCVNRLKLAVAAVGGALHVFGSQGPVFPACDSSQWNQPRVKPEFRFVGYLGDGVEAPAYWEAQSLPSPEVSIFGIWDVPEPSPSVPLTAFSRLVSLAGLGKVPGAALTRLERAVGVGCGLTPEGDCMHVVVSSCESDLNMAESMLRSFATKSAGLYALKLQLPADVDLRSILKKLQDKWDTFVAEIGGGTLLVIGRDLVARLACALELLVSVGSSVSQLVCENPSVVSVFPIGILRTTQRLSATLEAEICRRAGLASGAAVSVSGDQIFVAGSDEQRLTARSCLDLLVHADVDDMYIPLQRFSSALACDAKYRHQSYAAFEQKWGCIICHRALKGELIIVSNSIVRRVGAAVALLATVEHLLRPLAMSSDLCIVEIPVGSAETLQLATDNIAEAMQVSVQPGNDDRSILIGGVDRRTVAAARELLMRMSGLSFQQSLLDRFTTSCACVSVSNSVLSELEEYVGCAFFFDAQRGVIEIVAKHSLRRAMAAHILSQPDVVAAFLQVTNGW